MTPRALNDEISKEQAKRGFSRARAHTLRKRANGLCQYGGCKEKATYYCPAHYAKTRVSNLKALKKFKEKSFALPQKDGQE